MGIIHLPVASEGLLIIRIIVSLGLYWGPPILGSYHIKVQCRKFLKIIGPSVGAVRGDVQIKELSTCKNLVRNGGKRILWPVLSCEDWEPRHFLQHEVQ